VFSVETPVGVSPTIRGFVAHVQEKKDVFDREKDFCCAFVVRSF
jgi:hypothetical protein